MSESILTLPIAQKSWASLDSILVAEIQEIFLNSPNPWRQIKAVPKLVEQVVMDVLQRELDVATPGEEYFTVCMKSLRALSEERDIFPESFQCANIIKKGELPFSGGGFTSYGRPSKAHEFSRFGILLMPWNSCTVSIHRLSTVTYEGAIFLSLSIAAVAWPISEPP
ncbi:uncharacterized protein ARMOST_07689 [Armillaria ostoyae]|uniref:Uncharacterized protein n=1 Tax=Armillaria ostoyae TaxID=47428 RepID=A0A284R6H2_ARMOS|nr:uncharacterized protein ARMOST_07689 [Armillaria ostoyae]